MDRYEKAYLLADKGHHYEYNYGIFKTAEEAESLRSVFLRIDPKREMVIEEILVTKRV